jgi:cell division protein FtsI (penicillin-binding protein 3)
MNGMPAGPGSALAPHERLRRRTLGIKIVVLLLFVILALRLVQIQVVRATEFQEIARKQYEAPIILPAARGAITDRNGKVLVSNSTFVTFGADPKVAGNERDDIAMAMSRVFRRPREVYLDAMRDTHKRYVVLERDIEPARAARVPAAELRGLIALNEPRRIYHYDHTAGQLIGVTGMDHAGLSGLEMQYDRMLRGTDGSVTMQRDALNRTRASAEYPRIDPKDGLDLELTIDAEYQQVAEDELARGVKRMQAESGLVVMVDPATGEILAVAHVPSVDPNNTATLDQATLRNRTVTDTFEPGSIFKIVTVTAALEKGVVRLDETFNGEHGKYSIPIGAGRTKPITDSHPLGIVTFRSAVEQSSNIVMAKLSTRIGAQTLFETARKYGFGTLTGIELPGEVQGDLKRPVDWSGSTLPIMSYGYEVAVTPLQMVMAYAAVANKGILMKPFVVRRLPGEDGEENITVRPTQVRRVMAEETARTLTSLFEGVVQRGTGTLAKVEGLRIAGKTGTSKKVVGGHYKPGDYTASFVGFFPADDPHIVCLVMLENPRGSSYYGGPVSAPIFKGIAEKIFAMAGKFKTVQQTVMARATGIIVPDVRNMKAEDAEATLEAGGLEAENSDDGPIVIAQSPAPGTTVERGSTVTLSTLVNAKPASGGFALVPDVRGLTIRRAMNSLAVQQLDAVVVGTGTVVGQTPAPGERLRHGATVTLRCEARQGAPQPS